MMRGMKDILGSYKMIMKKLVVILLVLCMSFSLCACGLKKVPEIAEPAEIPVETPEAVQPVEEQKESMPVLPTATSDDLKLYAYALSNGQKYVVDEYGRYSDQFRYDIDGNIVDEDGTMKIMSGNVRNYRPIRTMYFSQESYTLTAEGSTPAEGNALSSAQVYSNCIVELFCAPASATNGVICVRSDSDAVIEIRPNNNARFITLENSGLEDGEVVLRADDLSQPIRIYVRVLSNLIGEAKIIARSLDRSAEAECMVTVELSEAGRTQTTGTNVGTNIRYGMGTAATTPIATPTPTPTPAIAPIQNATEFVNASGNPGNHVHSYAKTVTPPTTAGMGYTTYTCTKCGYSYQDDFTSKLSPGRPAEPTHTHSYTSITVQPTETEQGYTLFVCDLCGDSYKTNFTPAARA